MRVAVRFTVFRSPLTIIASGVFARILLAPPETPSYSRTSNTDGVCGRHSRLISTLWTQVDPTVSPETVATGYFECARKGVEVQVLSNRTRITWTSGHLRIDVALPILSGSSPGKPE